MKYLYCIENKVSGKKYIGVTIDPERRWKQHINPKVKKNSAIKDAINKYGEDQFTFEVLHFDTDINIDHMEVELIRCLDTQVPNGYNFTIGGDGASYIKWDESWNKLLGTDTDKVISEQLNLGHGLITNRRVGLKIPSFRAKNSIDWDKFDPLLGELTDKALSEKVGCSSSTVENRRNKLGISSKSPTKVRYNYPKDLIESLGSIPDTELSEKFNIPATAITQKRNSLGIKKAKLLQGWRKRIWTEEQIKVLVDSSIKAKDASLMLDVSLSAVTSYRQEKEVDRYTGLDKSGKVNYIPLQGEFLEDLLDEDMSTRSIADKYQLGFSTVHYKRNKSKSFLKIKEERLNE